MPVTILYDHSDELIDRLPAAVDAGLRAMAYVYYNEVKRALAGGYTSGDFVTGRVLNSVTVGEPFDATTGAPDRAIEVGTDVLYAFFWEAGHYNLFTRKYERVELWRESLDAMGPEMEDVYSGTVLSWMLQGAPE